MSSSTRSNRRIVLAARPQGAADLACFRLEEAPLEELRDGEVLLRNLWLSLDPYMRGRMSDAPSYAPPVALGAVMTGGTVARIEASRHPRFSVGGLVVASGGWQEYAISDGSDLTPLAPDLERPSYALGVLGMTGFTAYIGLLAIGKPRPQETVVVTAATGAVGSIVGQIAKIQGCRVVGIAGGAEKCAWAVQELGFDACIDHQPDALRERVAQACPQGIDVYFESVGGKVLRAVLPLLNVHARIPLCGLISQYDAAPPPGQGGSVAGLMRTLLVKRVSLEGFIISDGYDARHAEFLEAMGAWLRAGRIKYREDVVVGLENAPGAFLGLLAGRNFGKLVVQLSGAEERNDDATAGSHA